MISIRAIFTVGTIVLAVTALQSQAVGQTPSSSTAPSATGSQNGTFFGYTGFIGDEEPDPTVFGAAISDKPSDTGFSSYAQDDTPDVPTPELDDTAGIVSDDYGSCDGSCEYQSWATFEYMHAWARGRWLPPLVTRSPPGVNGVLPDAGVRFGDDFVGGGLQASGRLSIGTWLDQDMCFGVGGKFFALEGDSTGYTGRSDATGSPTIARPFYNTDPIFLGPDSLVVTSPGIRTGSILASADNDVMGAEAYLRLGVLRCVNRRVDLLVGYHYTRVDDSLSISHSMEQIGGLDPVGTLFEFEDLFDVHNEFHGAELGILSEFDHGPFTLSLMGKLSMGNMRETLTISGRSSRTTPAGVNTPFPGYGLLAMPTNTGTYTRDDFTVVPEAEIKLTCRITQRLDASIGYTLVYWSDMALAGQQIDTSRANMPTVNASQLLGAGLFGPPNPGFGGIRDTNFWIQCLSLGFTYKY